jgi:hypothetical protein
MTSIYFDEDLRRGLKLLKEREGIPESESVRRAVRQWLTERKALPAVGGKRKTET